MQEREKGRKEGEEGEGESGELVVNSEKNLVNKFNGIRLNSVKSENFRKE